MNKKTTTDQKVVIKGGKPTIQEATGDQTAPAKEKVEMIEHGDGVELPTVEEVKEKEAKADQEPEFDKEFNNVNIIERDRETPDERKERIDEQIKDNLPDGVVKEPEEPETIEDKKELDKKIDYGKMSTDEALAKLATSPVVNVEFQQMIKEGNLRNPKEVAKILTARGFLIKY